MKTDKSIVRDQYSYSDPEEIRVKHIDLDLDVRFEDRTLNGTAILSLNKDYSGILVLDTRDLTIENTAYSSDGDTFSDNEFELGEAHPALGAPLRIYLPRRAKKIRIRYSTSPNASGLQWLEPIQTSSKTLPFLFTQSEATHARSWIPLQDTPQIRVSYTARVRRPKNLLALMSAENNPTAYDPSDHAFVMRKAIPSYLIALAVGDLDYRNLGVRTGVYAEPPIINSASHEFEDIERMICAAEGIFGPYRWGRYDVLVLPPSFPLGGMENPCLTFATPTVLAGDKSLVSLVAHELAHAWSSNLVSNATWRDFWLNEGFTVYIERRIIESVYGRQREEMEATLGRHELDQELARLNPTDQVLHRAEVNGDDPNAGYSQVPYEKGALFLRSLEQIFGRKRFDAFMGGYFEHFAFQSITTDQFVGYLNQNLLQDNPQLAARAHVQEWIYMPGLPPGAPRPTSEAFARVEAQTSRWLQGTISLDDLQTGSWSSQEWVRFLQIIPQGIGAAKMEELDLKFGLTNSENAELVSRWLVMAIRNEYTQAYHRLDQFLTTIGRRKYLKPLYKELGKTIEGRQLALKIYQKAWASYHPITRAAIDDILRSQNRVLGDNTESAEERRPPNNG